MQQRIGFCRSGDGTGIAYAGHGSGPPLLKTANWLTHLEKDWESPVWRHWLDAFGETHTMVRYDERGCGLSDREIGRLDLETWIADLDAVVDAAGYVKLGVTGRGARAAAAARYVQRG